MRSFWLAVCVLIVTSSVLAQDAQTVYRAASESIFLVYVNDANGTPVGQGTAFLVSPRTLITNNHVVKDGTPVLAVGPARMPLKVLRTDPVNDLALLSTDIDLTSSPLILTKDNVSPGQSIYTIGNPEGLEKSISQGIVSGLRTNDGRTLIQITSPISHGSSGGPVLNSRGEVLGVTVGTLTDGQNLNFAIPVKYVQALLEQQQVHAPEAPACIPRECLEEARTLVANVTSTQYTADLNSPYQRNIQRLTVLTKSALTSDDASLLADLACLGTRFYELSETGIEAGKKLYRLHPSATNAALLSYVLLDRAEDFAYASFTTTNTEKTLKTSLDQLANQFYADAADGAARAFGQAKTRPPVATFVFSTVLYQRDKLADSIPGFTEIANTHTEVCGNDLTKRAFRSLITVTNKLGRSDEASRWFSKYARLYTPSAYDWDAEGDRHYLKNEVAAAAYAYEKAATSDINSYGYDYCYAATSRWLIPGNDNSEAVLSDGRQCISAAAGNPTSSIAQQYEKQLPQVKKAMAGVLNDRGVYDGALSLIKESLAVKHDDAYSFHIQSRVLENLGRYSECIASEQAAVRLSDGKYEEYHFTLGNCYFDISDWVHAAQSFRNALTLSPKDSNIAFNLALSLLNQGYKSEAQHWFREALTMNPSPDVRAKIISALQR